MNVFSTIFSFLIFIQSEVFEMGRQKGENFASQLRAFHFEIKISSTTLSDKFSLENLIFLKK